MARTLYVKNMVCPRCVMTVESILDRYNIPYKEVKLGQAILDQDIDDKLVEEIDNELRKVGFELISDPKKIIVEQIKAVVIEYIRYDTLGNKKVNFSDYLTQRIGKSYSYLSEIFSKSEGKTIERYLILQKIERVKELISYGEMNFSEIAYELNYSSVAHLSRQFKQITGMTLSQFREKALSERKSLDQL